MKLFKSYFPYLIQNGILWMLWAYLARAYLEPGATSFFLKILISVLAGFVFVFRYIWLAVRSLFAKPAPPKNSGEQKEENP